ncbi:MAG: substrate-binding domain-containing protein [Succinivibrio dextrinosolvens]|uniref:LacI family DNA-binding transcriptional regulator n=1 Tax=Succinivibrio sp. TaxID=2053619 RepID=UPI0025FDB0ED|nr:substrate-binding domain-containing protein [Succinivibrio sp.]MBQ9219567.1 substrate-binding domain-containing protein [Succinivibrio sp.]MDY6466036.1 substrate-binding domain-containing protein [Succinivibrio dextrinosolvens]MDY6469880.1 substrate-binding domain-containing protein [Succinivibrio dextrinosolvens]
MSVTLKDLAKASGVSIGTVSRALNDKNEVSAKTSERIRQLAQELGYIPNRAGRALSSQKSINYVGIVIPSINSPFFDDIKKGIDMALKEFKDLGIDVVIKEQEGWNVDTQIRALEELENSGCKAFVLCSVDSEEIRTKIAELSDKGYPVVLLNNDLPGTKRLCFVGPDYLKSGKVAAAMVDKCHPGIPLKILVVVGYKSHLGHKTRLDGFISELKSRRQDYEIVDVIEGNDQDIITQQVTMKAFMKHPEVNVVYMATGSGVSGLGAAIIADSEHKRFILACDEIYTTKELVKNDIIDFVICQSPVVQGYQVIKKLHDYLNKIGNLPEDYIVDTVIKVKSHFD